MSEREKVARALCAAANVGVDPDTPTHFGEPFRVFLPSWPQGYVVPPHEPRPLWQYFLPMADRAIAAMERDANA